MLLRTVELLWHYATFQEKFGEPKPAVKASIEERLESARQIYVDYNYSDDFRCEIPLEWISLAPTNILFVMKSEPRGIATNQFAQVAIGTVSGASRNFTLAQTKLLAPIMTINPEMTTMTRASFHIIDAIAGFGSINPTDGLDILEVVPSYGRFYWSGPNTKRPSYYILFEGDEVAANRKDIKSYSLHFDYPGFGVDFPSEDVKGQTKDIEWGDLAPVKISLTRKDTGKEFEYDIFNIHYVTADDAGLSAIAHHYGTTLKDVLAINPQIKNPDLILPGQKLYIPKPRFGK